MDDWNSKKLNARDISEILNIEEPPEIPGGTIHKDWLIAAISKAPGCEDIDLGLNKQDLLKAGIEVLGGIWDDNCVTDLGGDVNAVGLSRFALLLEPRLNEMRQIWSLLGKKGYPNVDQDKFVSTIYGHYFDREMVSDAESSIHEILSHVDENHGLSDDEITIEGEPTSSAYPLILADLFYGTEDDDVESDYLTGIIRTVSRID